MSILAAVVIQANHLDSILAADIGIKTNVVATGTYTTFDVAGSTDIPAMAAVARGVQAEHGLDLGYGFAPNPDGTVTVTYYATPKPHTLFGIPVA